MLEEAAIAMASRWVDEVVGLNMAKELENEAEFVQLAQACDFLEHYHLEHTDDMVTRFQGKLGTSEGDRPDIYVVSDPEWKRKMGELVAPIFPEDRRPLRKGHLSRRVHGPWRGHS